MTFRKTGGLSSGVFAVSANGSVLRVPGVLDFTQCKPSVVRPKPAAPEHRSAVLRYRHRPRAGGSSEAAYTPVDPVYLVYHLEFAEAGRVIRVSSALVGFLCRVAAASMGRGGRLLVGGCPAATSRSISRGTQLKLEPRVVFSSNPDIRCQVRGCGAARVAGCFCAAHYDSTFAHGMLRRHIQRDSRASIMLSKGVRSELNIVFSEFDGFWRQVGQWLGGGGGALSGCRVRTLVVNHASDHVQTLATTDLSADRIAALAAYATHRLSQGSQSFYNALLAITYTRTQQERTAVLAARVARDLSRFRLSAAPAAEASGKLVCDAGIVTFRRMPVLPAVDGWVGRTDGGLLAATVIPGPDEVPTAVVFSVSALRVLSRVFGTVGEFSFTVRTGSMAPLPDDAIVLDAAAPLDLTRFMRHSGLERAELDLHVLTPAALSTTVLAAIIFHLRFRHVVFCGPRLGEHGIALPVFEAAERDPMVGFLWRCILDEAAARGTLRVDTGGDPLWRHGGVGFLDTFVAEKTPVRCTNVRCQHCTAESTWHTDHLLAEACFGQKGITMLPVCTLKGLQPFDPDRTRDAVELWRTLCEPELEVESYF